MTGNWVWLSVFLALGACSKKSSPDGGSSSSSPSASASVVHASSSWFESFASKKGKGWFDVVTDAATHASSLAGGSCAVWSLFYEGKSDTLEKRIFFDGWPPDAFSIAVDGKPIAVPMSAIVWELPPTLKTFRASDADLPAKVKEMLTVKTWMGKDDDVLPTSVDATEHCLSPATTYRAELRESEETDFGDGNQYAAPSLGQPSTTTSASASSAGLSPKEKAIFDSFPKRTVYSLAIAAK